MENSKGGSRIISVLMIIWVQDTKKLQRQTQFALTPAPECWNLSQFPQNSIQNHCHRLFGDLPVEFLTPMGSWHKKFPSLSLKSSCWELGFCALSCWEIGWWKAQDMGDLHIWQVFSSCRYGSYCMAVFFKSSCWELGFCALSCWEIGFVLVIVWVWVCWFDKAVV